MGASAATPLLSHAASAAALHVVAAGTHAATACLDLVAQPVLGFAPGEPGVLIANAALWQAIGCTSAEVADGSALAGYFEQEAEGLSVLGTLSRPGESARGVELATAVTLYCGHFGPRRFRLEVARSASPAPGGPSALATFYDIDDELGDRERIELARGHLELLEGSLEFGVFDWSDVSVDEVHWSDSMYRLLGLEPDSVAARPSTFYAYVHPSDAEALAERTRHALDVPGESYDHDFRLRQPDGSYRWAYTRGRSFVGDDGRRRLVGFCLLVDHASEETLEVAQLQQELEEFVYSVSHDLRTPVRHIQSYAEMLRAERVVPEDAAAGVFLVRLEETSRRLGVMLDRLLHYRTLRSVLRRRSWVSLEAVVREYALHADRAHAERVAIEVAGALPEVRATPQLLTELMSELLDNAVRHARLGPTPEAARVTVAARELPDGGGIEVSVADNGDGFDPAHADKLFGIFQRIHEAAPGDREGLGLGLAVARRIVRLHGGDIRASGRVNRGARFGFVIPETRWVQNSEHGI